LPLPLLLLLQHISSLLRITTTTTTTPLSFLLILPPWPDQLLCWQRAKRVGGREEDLIHLEHFRVPQGKHGYYQVREEEMGVGRSRR